MLHNSNTFTVSPIIINIINFIQFIIPRLIDIHANIIKFKLINLYLEIKVSPYLVSITIANDFFYTPHVTLIQFAYTYLRTLMQSRLDLVSILNLLYDINNCIIS